MALMEVLPLLLARRVFRPLASMRQVEPGYREAPDPSAPMAIVFCKVGRGEGGGAGCGRGGGVDGGIWGCVCVGEVGNSVVVVVVVCVCVCVCVCV